MRIEQMRNNYLYSALCASALTVASPVTYGSFIDFGVGGGNTIDEVYSFDWLPGTSYTDGGVGNQLSDGDILDTYVQGSLGSFLDQNGNTISNNFGLGTDYEVTFVAGFKEVVFGINGFVNPVTNEFVESLNFSSVESTMNFYEVWIDFNPDSDPLEGTGFNNGTLISSGTVLPGGGGNITSNFAFSGDPDDPVSQDPNDYGFLDQFGANNWGNTRTNEGIGGSQFNVLSDFVNNDFIMPYLNGVAAPGSQMNINFNSSQKVAFSETNPARQYVDEDGNLNSADVGTINGINGDGVLLQVDGNSSFLTVPNEVPTPGILWLFGIGILAGVASSYRKLA